MDVLFALIQDVIANWHYYAETINNIIVSLCTLLGGVVVLASAIAKFTPTPKDDEFLSKVTAVIARLSVIKLKGTK